MTENSKSAINEINLEDLKQKKKKSKIMYIRTTDEISKWMAKREISPTKLFNEAARVLMEKDGNNKTSSNKE